MNEELRALAAAIRATVPKPERGEPWETSLPKATLHQLADVIDGVEEVA
jgi:hypothetical protein